MARRGLLGGLVLALLVALAGCATPRIGSEVRAFSSLPGQPQGGYRFEQLPSQQADAAQQAMHELMAETALARVGLVRDDRAPRYSLWLGVASTVVALNSWDDHFWAPTRYGWGPYWRPGVPLYAPAFPSAPRYRHEVTLVLRDLASQQVVFETRAVHEGYWRQAERVLPALLDAALRDFPRPPSGVRHLDAELPR